MERDKRRVLIGLAAAVVAGLFLVRGAVSSLLSVLGPVSEPVRVVDAPPSAVEHERVPGTGVANRKLGTGPVTKAVKTGGYRDDPFAPLAHGAVGERKEQPADSGMEKSKAPRAPAPLLPPPPETVVAVPAVVLAPDDQRGLGNMAAAAGRKQSDRQGRREPESAREPVAPASGTGTDATSRVQVLAAVQGPLGCTVLISRGGKVDIVATSEALACQASEER